MAYSKEKSESYSLLGGINNKASPYVNDIAEFRDITNLNFATPGALTKRPGTSLYLGATISGRISSITEFERLNGSSYVIASANTNIYKVTGSFTSFKTGLLNNGIFDFVTFVDRLFCSNGQDFFKYDGNATSSYSLPDGAAGWGVTAIIGGGLSGNYIASFGYLNDRGYYGPCATHISIALNGATFGTIGYYGLTTPAGFGISAIAFYRTSAGGSELTGTTTIAAGVTSFASDIGWPLTSRICEENLYFTLAPKYLEIFNNQLFLSGFSAAPSTVFWSQIGEPEGVDPSFNAEFRTNDGDRVTGMKSYAGALVVSKERSFHRITGDNPSNFFIQEVSDQYGCLSNRAMVSFEDRLWFLDSKGIVEYDGAGVKIVSNKVEDLFKKMNIPAARENAVALHARDYNEVWFAIPCNGATFNNCVVVYDYLSSAWTKYEGVNPSSLGIAQGSTPNKTPFVGGYSGNVSFYSATFMYDMGSAMTCMAQSAFLAPTGETTEKQYRRFYLNLESVVGVTQPISVNFRTNYGTTIALSRTMYQAPFQSRVDFGLPAKAINAEIIHASASLSLKVFGYSFESRYQRAT